MPGERWRFNDREYASRTAQLSNGGCIGWRQLEPLADGAVVDAQLSSDRPSGRDVLVQGMHLGDAQRAPRDAPSIPFRICIMLVRRRRRATQSAEQGRPAGRWRCRQRSSDLFNDVIYGVDNPTSGVEQAQLVHRRRLGIGQHRRVEPRIVSDDLVGRKASGPQSVDEDLNHA